MSKELKQILSTLFPLRLAQAARISNFLKGESMSDIEEAKSKEVNETQAMNRIIKILEPMTFGQADRVLHYLRSRLTDKLAKELKDCPSTGFGNASMMAEKGFFHDPGLQRRGL